MYDVAYTFRSISLTVGPVQALELLEVLAALLTVGAAGADELSVLGIVARPHINTALCEGQ